MAPSDRPGAGCSAPEAERTPRGAAGDARAAASSRDARAGNPPRASGRRALAGPTRRGHDPPMTASTSRFLPMPSRRTAHSPNRRASRNRPTLSPTLQRRSPTPAARLQVRQPLRHDRRPPRRPRGVARQSPDGLAMPGDHDRTPVRPAAPHAARLPRRRRRRVGDGRLRPVDPLVPQPPRRPARDAAPPRPPPDRGAGDGGPRSQRPRPDHPRPGPLDGAARDADRLLPGDRDRRADPRVRGVRAPGPDRPGGRVRAARRAR